MSVYFVQAGKDGPVKIGYAGNVKSRLEQLQCHNAEKLRVLSVIRGSKAVETDLHRKFHAYHIRGEWFALKGTFAGYVAKLPRPGAKRDLSEQECLRRSRIGQVWFNPHIESDIAAARVLRMDARMLRRGLGPSGRNCAPARI